MNTKMHRRQPSVQEDSRPASDYPRFVDYHMTSAVEEDFDEMDPRHLTVTDVLGLDNRFGRTRYDYPHQW
jgi:hypothetical protein